MSISASHYALLSRDAYNDHKVGRFAENAGPLVDIDGAFYYVREHISNPRNGYQGTIYQNEKTGEFVVAHRGTEMDKGFDPLLKDALYTDGQMVFDRENPQARDAIELTRRALEIAKAEAPANGRVPEVTVTGHSLGGGLAQITAHHFDLRGETFNAYGAVSLDRRIPEGGNRVVNHAMATDFVSAASQHYGEVRLYATPEQVQRLVAMGYEADRPRMLDQRAPLAVAADVDAHYLRHFVGTNADGTPGRSVLAENNDYPALVAGSHREIIDRYRDDVRLLRGSATALSRSGLELIGDAQRLAEGADGPGGPAARERDLAAALAPRPPPRPLDEIDNFIQREPRPREPQWPEVRLEIPGAADGPARDAVRAPLRPSDPVAFDALRTGVNAIDTALGRSPDGRSERMTAALYAEMKTQGVGRIDGVVLGGKGAAAEPGEYVFAWRGSPERPDDWISVRTDVSTRTPVEDSLARAEEAVRTQRQEAAMRQQQDQDAPAMRMA
jgi:hypothetical protein